MTYQEPDLLVTSSFDGDIILWDIHSEQVIAIVNATDIDFSAQFRRLYGKVVGKQTDIQELKETGKILSMEFILSMFSRGWFS